MLCSIDILIMSFLLHEAFGQYSSVTELRTHILPYLDAVCPNAKVCTEYRPDFVQKEMDGFFIPCCAECSCADDCHIDGNCCFSSEKTRTPCISTVIPPPRSETFRFTPNYHMISQPPATGCITDSDYSSEHPLIKPAPWGELYPVTSLSTKRTYKNQSIAECYNDLDGVQWNVNMSCDIYFQINDMDSVFENFDPTNSSSPCSLQFEYPGDSQDIDKARCFPDSIDTCMNSSFPIPENINLTEQDYMKLCESNFQSTLLHQTIYKNAFCRICNGILSDMVCTSNEGRSPIPAFSVILSPGYIKNPSSTHRDILQESAEIACLTSNIKTDECRIIHCPKFQQRAYNGKCEPQWDSVGVTIFRLALKLIPETKVRTEQWFIRGSNPNIWLDSPWDWPWRIAEMYREMNDPTESNVYVILKAETKTEMGELLDHISEKLSNIWKAPFDNNHIYFRQQSNGFYIDPINAFPSVLYINKESGEAVSKILEVLYFEFAMSLLQLPIVPLTPLYFCKQIELESHEYLLDGNGTMTYKTKNTTLLPSEYTISRNNPRICLEDSVFVKLKSRATRGWSFPFSLYMATVFLMINPFGAIGDC